jgi:hypothetical protein
VRRICGWAAFLGSAAIGAPFIEAGALASPVPVIALSGWQLPAVRDSVNSGSESLEPATFAEGPAAPVQIAWQPVGDEPAPPPVTGPLPVPENGPADDRPRLSFGKRVEAAKWETAAIFGYMTATQIAVTKGTRSFHFQDEGWFGKNTTNLGIDKLTHAYNSYLLAELLHWRISRKTGDAHGSAFTAAVLASGLMVYSELFDAHKKTSGFSVQDVLSNTAGAAFSALRNTTPGLKDKLDFRLLLIPNSDIITLKGKRHYEQQRFLMALQLGGFDTFRDSPLRFVELHAGYRATGFTNPQRQRGERLRRSVFLGVGLNLNELFFRNSRSGVGRIAGQALNYIQVPYTAFYVDATK